MITNDPGTPGDAKWEINLAATGGHAGAGWEVTAPNLDINRGVGEHVQLSVQGGWAHARDDDGAWRSGWSDLEFGLRWRFLDDEKAGIAMAVQPVWSKGWSASARRRGLASEHPDFFLPVQASHDFGDFAAGVEIGRHFVSVDPDAWQGGAYLAHACWSRASCIAEVNLSQTDGERVVPTINVGTRAPLGDTCNLLASLGSELRGENRQKVIFYLGVQFVP